MNRKLFNYLLLFSLFGVALGFFGMLYEGVVYGPKLINASADRLLIWKGFFAMVNPVIYYTPWYHLATLVLLFLYIKTPAEEIRLKKRLKMAGILQIISFVFIIYILIHIDLGQAFANLNGAAEILHGKAVVFNILSVCRIVTVAISLSLIFNAYIQTQKELV